MSTVFQRLQEGIGSHQNNRLLRLSFPHGDGPASPLLVNTLDAVESLSRDFAFTVGLLSDDATLALKALQGKLLCVELVRKDGSLRYFSGHCFEFRLVGADGGLAFYEAKLAPWLRYASLRKDNFLFHGKTLREQSELIFRDYAPHADWDFRLRGEDAPMTDACQFDESDFNYLSRRWEAAGWHYFYEHTEKGHKLILSDDSTQAIPIDGDPEIRFQRDGGAQEEDAIGDWSPVRHMAPGNITLAGFDFKNPMPASVNVPTLNRQGDVPDIESYEYAGAHGFRSRQDGDRLARLRMEEMEAAGKRFEAQGNNRSVHPGRWFRLTDHFAFDPFCRDTRNTRNTDTGGNEFLVLQVHHTASNNYPAQADGKAATAGYSIRLTCMRRLIPWRPGRHFNSTETRILAPQTATVVGPSAQDGIHTDEYGRVRVQFHWDRIGGNDERSSAWIRVATGWAGAAQGMIAIPRVGSEVIVQWLDGNPDRPIITGSVYNGRNPPPWELPAQQALTGLRSRELASGDNAAGGRGNYLILDDTGTKIQAQLKSDHQHSQLCLGHITRIEDHAGRKDARGEGWEIASNAWGVARAGKGMLITTEARPNAASHIKDMGETAQRLMQAHDRHNALANALAEAARQSGAQEAQGQQTDVTQAIKAQNDAIRGADGSSEPFPELAAPHLVLASPAGIETTTAHSTHIASDRHTAITSGKSLSIASGDGLFASIRNTIRLFAHKAGMKLIAAAGDIDMQALQHSIHLLAKLDITHSAGRITITAKEEVLINGGGSYAKFSAGGIEHGTNGSYLAHAAAHGFPGAKSMPVTMPPMPVATDVAGYSQSVNASQLLSHWIGQPRQWANIPFEAYNEQNELIHAGTTDQHAMTPSIYTRAEQELTIAFNADDWQIDVEEEMYDATDSSPPSLNNQSV